MSVPYVKVARKAFESDPWWTARRKFSAFEAWLDMIQLARWADYTLSSGDFGTVKLERGEFCLSLSQMAKRWGWTVKRVRCFVDSSEYHSRITAQRRTRAGVVYRIVNYDTYQDAPATKGTLTGIEGAQKGHSRGTRENPCNTRNPTTLVDGVPSAGERRAEGPELAAFEQAWAIYPRRAGGNSKADAYRAFLARCKEGAALADLIAGTERYAAFCQATGKVGTEYVKQARTFFGPSKHYEEAWAPPPPAVDSLEARAAALLAQYDEEDRRSEAFLRQRGSEHERQPAPLAVGAQ